VVQFCLDFALCWMAVSSFEDNGSVQPSNIAGLLAAFTCVES
jgi:hypothetical protein